MMKILTFVNDTETLKAAIAAGSEMIAMKLDYMQDISYARLFGSEVYIDLDYVVTDNNIHFLIDKAYEAYSLGCAGAIVSEPGLARLLRKDMKVIAINHKEGDHVLNTNSSNGSCIIGHGDPEIRYMRNRLMLTKNKNLYRHKRFSMDREICLLESLELIRNQYEVLVIKSRKRPDNLYKTICLYKKALNGEIDREEMILNSDKQLYNPLEPDKRYSDGIYLGKIFRGALKLDRELKKGDKIIIKSNRKASFKISYILINGERYEKAYPGDSIKLRFPHFANGSKIYKSIEKEEDVPEPAIDISCRAVLKEGNPISIGYTFKDTTVNAEGKRPVEKAEKTPLAHEDIKRRLSRVKPFRVVDMDLEADEDIVVPYSELHKVRNDAIAKLKQKMLPAKKAKKISYTPKRSPGQGNVEFHVQVDSPENAAEALRAEADVIYYDIFSTDVTEVQDICRQHGAEFFLITPRIVNDRDAEHITKLVQHYKPDGILVGNPVLLNRCPKVKKHLDYNFNLTSTEAFDYWKLPGIVSLDVYYDDLPVHDGAIMYVYGKPKVSASKESVKQKHFIERDTPYRYKVFLDKMLVRMQLDDLAKKGYSRFFLDVDKDVYETLKEYRLMLESEQMTASRART